MVGSQPAEPALAAELESAVEAQSALEQPPGAARIVFGAAFPVAEQFAHMLATQGVVRGVIGPHEPARIWTRHLLNCAAISDLFAPGTRVVDLGSGAGLPGIALAIRRPDLRVDLVEPLQRRVDFLLIALAVLELTDRVRVVRGRATDPAVVAQVGNAPWVIARAVAPLHRLVGWCLPLLAADGRAALMKGDSAGDELRRYQAAARRAGALDPRLVTCGLDVIEPPVSVITFGVTRSQAARKRKR